MASTLRAIPANADVVPSKAARLKAEIASPQLSFLMEAHDGISSKIVEEAGFKGIWASGLAISSALGVRDSNEASWTQVLEVLEFMSDATTIPILVDGDTGYGNFNNVRRLVRKLCQRGIAGVCIEDKLFPKTNSFIGDGQPLADMDEFCGKIKAGKDSQTDDDFQLVARIEALISGWGMEEALRRAEAYHAAGADALLVHSKMSSATEILGFMKEWGDRCPVVIVPTTYYGTPTEAFRDAGVSTIIWANHNLRASINAMRETCRAIMREESVVAIEGKIATVKEIFDLVGNKELTEAENRYLPSAREAARAIVLAATRGSQLGPLTEDRPKCMVDVRGQPLLRRLVATLRESGIRDVTVVRGYRKEAVDLPTIATVDNDAYETTGEAYSLAQAVKKIDGNAIVAFGDILFRHYILDQLMEAEGDVVLAVDARWRDREGQTKTSRDFALCSRPFTTDLLDDAPVFVQRVASDLGNETPSGEFIGLARLTPAGAKQVRAALDAMAAEGSLATASLGDLFNRLAADGAPPRALYVTGQWLDVNDAFDLARARNFL
ncbi:MAG: phosphoenolpyruvate mutase [Rhodospirillales bacterium]